MVFSRYKSLFRATRVPPGHPLAGHPRRRPPASGAPRRRRPPASQATHVRGHPHRGPPASRAIRVRGPPRRGPSASQAPASQAIRVAGHLLGVACFAVTGHPRRGPPLGGGLLRRHGPPRRRPPASQATRVAGPAVAGHLRRGWPLTAKQAVPGACRTMGRFSRVPYTTAGSSILGKSGFGVGSLIPAGTGVRRHWPCAASPLKPRYLCSCCEEKGR